MKGDPAPVVTVTGPFVVSDELVDAMARLLLAVPDPGKDDAPGFPGVNPTNSGGGYHDESDNP